VEQPPEPALSLSKGLLFALLLLALLASCGGSGTSGGGAGGNGTPPGGYTVTVTAFTVSNTTGKPDSTLIIP